MSHSETIAIAPAEEADLPDLARALAALSADLGDSHRASEAALYAACFGPVPVCHGLLARAGLGAAPAGVALISPVFSTTLGGPGAYVSDLWVGRAHRGLGLGRRLLQEAARLATRRWQARFLKLTVYAGNTGARDFYAGLGFAVAERDRSCLLGGAAFDSLLGGEQ